MDERDQKLLAALLEIATAIRDPKLVAALFEIATEIRTLRVMLMGAIAPALRDEEGTQTREGFLRTEEQHPDLRRDEKH